MSSLRSVGPAARCRGAESPAALPHLPAGAAGGARAPWLVVALTAAAWMPGAAAQDATASAAAATSSAGATTGASGSAPASGIGIGVAGAGVTGNSGRVLPITIVPSVSLTQTVTHGDSRVAGDKRFESITQLSPGVRVSAGAGRVKGFLDYTLNAQHETGDGGGSDLQQTLNASLAAELVEGRAFVDVRAGIAQQSISALGPQYSNDTQNRANRTEVKTYAVSPYVRGTLPGSVDYELRVSRTASYSEASAVSDNATTDGRLVFSGGTGLRALSWSLLGTRQVFDYQAGRQTASNRFSADLAYAVTQQLQLSARGGREASDISTIERTSGNTHGFGFAWRPSEVTALTANQERRVYGNTHAISFSHRSARTVLTYTDARDVTAGDARAGIGSLGTAYDLFYRLSNQADPALRRLEVLADLQRRGLSPDIQVLSGFLSSAASLQRSQALSMAWLGLRDTATLLVSQSNSRRVDQVTTVVDDLSTSDTIRQRGVSVNLAHRLTPLSTVSVSGSWQRSRGSADLAASRYTSFDLAWAAQVGARTSATVSTRRTSYSGSSAPYSETALTGAVSLRF